MQPDICIDFICNAECVLAASLRQINSSVLKKLHRPPLPHEPSAAAHMQSLQSLSARRPAGIMHASPGSRGGVCAHAFTLRRDAAGAEAVSVTKPTWLVGSAATADLKLAAGNGGPLAARCLLGAGGL